MRAVIFKTQNGVFKFDQKEVKEIIRCNRSKYDLDQVANLQELISTECNETIVIPEEPVYFDSIALDLISLRIPRPLGVVRGNRFYQIACSW